MACLNLVSDCATNSAACRSSCHSWNAGKVKNQICVLVDVDSVIVSKPPGLDVSTIRCWFSTLAKCDVDFVDEPDVKDVVWVWADG